MEWGVNEILGKLELMEEEDKVEVIQEADWNSSALNYDLVLVGRLLTSKAYNFEAFRLTVTQLMKPGRGLQIKQIGDSRLLFSFGHYIDRDRALKGCPWSFDKHVLLLAGIANGQDPLTVSLDKCEFYVQIRGLPFTKMTKEVAHHIGNRMGDFREADLDENGSSKYEFLRIKVGYPISKPLLRVMRITSSCGDQCIVNFQYERLPNFCYLCGILGHVIRECEKQYEDKYDSAKPCPYGSWIRTSAPSSRNGVKRSISPGNTRRSSGVVEQRTAARGTSIFGNFRKSGHPSPLIGAELAGSKHKSPVHREHPTNPPAESACRDSRAVGKYVDKSGFTCCGLQVPNSTQSTILGELHSDGSHTTSVHPILPTNLDLCAIKFTPLTHHDQPTNFGHPLSKSQKEKGKGLVYADHNSELFIEGSHTTSVHPIQPTSLDFFAIKFTPLAHHDQPTNFGHPLPPTGLENQVSDSAAHTSRDMEMPGYQERFPKFAQSNKCVNSL